MLGKSTQSEAMSLKVLPIREIKEVHLEQLITDKTAESHVIEYKRDWNLSDEKGKREFLADVASFANSAGGDIVYGMDAKDGVPTAIYGLDGFMREQEQLRAEDLLRSWIDPRLGGIEFAPIELKSGKIAFVIRVPRSWSMPHMVTFNNWDRFFGRSSAGRYGLDVRQLRGAFHASSEASNRMRDFRLERIGRIAAGEVGVSLSSRYCSVLHIMPLAELTNYDPAQVVPFTRSGLVPMGSLNSIGEQINLEGCMIQATGGDSTVYSYVQLFRNGFIEAALTSSGTERTKKISPEYELWVRKGLLSYCTVLRKMGLSPPHGLGLSLVNAQGFTMAEPVGQPWMRDIRSLDRPHLLLPIEIPSNENSSDSEELRLGIVVPQKHRDYLLKFSMELNAELLLSKGRKGQSHHTKRETEVHQLFNAGLKSKEIAEILGISDSTVRVHLASVKSRRAHLGRKV